ncbi:MAG: hypothetical protein WCC60_02385 [Ilumatobacteraceae bacterium]
MNQVKAAARIAMYLMIAYFAIKLWQNPSGSADATVNFIGAVGRFFASLIDKIGQFVQGLGS